MKPQIAALALLAACGGLPSYSVPAPEGALDCAVEEAAELGYRKLEGEVEAGVVRMGKYIPPPPGRDLSEPDEELGDVVLTDFEDIPLQSQIRLSYSGGELRVQVLSEREPDLATRRTGDASEDAQRVLASCTTPLP
jgi:hypothetical protein